MSARKRYRCPRGPRTSPRTWRIADRRGRWLSDAEKVPFSWTEREAMAAGFRSREAAERFVREKFGAVAAREMLGLRVVP